MDEFNDQVDKSSGPDSCWRWLGLKGAKGYGRIRVKGRWHRAHRLAWMAANGPIPTGYFILHSCDHPWCVNPSHLRPGTHRENMTDAGMLKLTEPAVRDIRATASNPVGRRAVGTGYRRLAKRFHVNPSTMRRVIQGRTWKDVV